MLGRKNRSYGAAAVVRDWPACHAKIDAYRRICTLPRSPVPFPSPGHLPRDESFQFNAITEAKRLVDECHKPLRPVVKFAFSTGLRRSNIINLEWKQIDMQRRVAWINPEESKSGRAIGVSLNDTACRVLRDQMGHHNKWVFVHMEANKRAGIENFRFQDLRHTWASW